jgi:hypothetical protein
MAKADFAAARKQAEDAGLLGGGDYYKFKEGDNRIRLMSNCLPHTSVFQGKSNFKWLCYVLDRRDNKIKAHFMPHKIYKAIEALQSNPDYTFEEVPMPYDITIHAKGAGTKEVEYSLIPARKETPLTVEERTELFQQKPLEDLQKALYEKQQAKGGSNGHTHLDDAPPVTDDDIAF